MSVVLMQTYMYLFPRYTKLSEKINIILTKEEFSRVSQQM